jgi:hypothetical protein
MSEHLSGGFVTILSHFAGTWVPKAHVIVLKVQAFCGTSKLIRSSHTGSEEVMNEHVNVDPNLSPNVPIEDQEARSVPPPAKIPSEESPKDNMSANVKDAINHVEVTLADASTEPKDGSSLEAAAEMSTLANVLREKASDVKRRADEVFVTGSVSAEPAADDPLKGKNIASELREQIQDLEEKIAQLKPADDDDGDEQVKDAEILDRVAQVLEDKAQELEELKRDLAAKELNDLDGFDR